MALLDSSKGKEVDLSGFPPIEIPEPPIEDNFTKSVMETIGKFESSSSLAIRNNNFGNIQYNKGGFAEQFGATPDEENPYIDLEGNQRFHARFPDRDTGMKAARTLAKDILKEVKGDAIKFAERWTGITDPSSREYETVKNYAKEIDRIFINNSKPVDFSSLVLPSPSAPNSVKSGMAVAMEGLGVAPTEDTSPPSKDASSFMDETIEAIKSFGRGVPFGFIQGSETYALVGQLMNVPNAETAVDYLGKVSEGFYDEPLDFLDSSLMGGVASSINSILSGLPGAVAGTFTGTGPVGTVAGFALSSGTLFTLAEYQRFLNEVKEFGIEQGMSSEELEQLRKESVPEAIISGVAEGGTEFIQALLLGKVLGFTNASKTLTKPAKQTIKQMATAFLKKMGITTPIESGGEQVTTVIQHLAAESANLPQGDLWEAMKQTLGTSLVQVFLMSGGAQIIQGRYADTSQNRQILKDQIMNLIEQKGINVEEENVDAFLTLVDFQAERKGIKIGDFIGQVFADVHPDDPTAFEDQLLQQIPDALTTKTQGVVETSFEDIETAESAMRKLRNGQVTKGEMEWLDLEDFINTDENVDKTELLHYLNMIGTQAGIEEKMFRNLETQYSQYAINQGAYEDYKEIVMHVPNSMLEYIHGFGFSIPEDYNSTIRHFEDIENVIAFARSTSRESNKGSYTLIEELQSDIHQKGFAEGYASWEDTFESDKNLAILEEKMREILHEYNNMSNDFLTSMSGYQIFSFLNMLEEQGLLLPEVVEDVNIARNQYKEILGKIDLPPKLPFHNKWIHLMAKRMVIEAINNGSDYIAWVSAENRIRIWGDTNIGWQDQGDGNINLYHAKGKFDTIDELIDSSGIVLERLKGNDSKEDAINKIQTALGRIGLDPGMAKGLYNRIMGSPFEGSMRPLEGLFSHIYDNMLPNIMKKITGEDIVMLDNDMYVPFSPEDYTFDEEVPTDIEGITEISSTPNVPTKYVGPVQAIPITDKVRERFLKGKQHLFQAEKGSVQFLEDGRAVLRMAQGADASTLFHELGHIIRRTLTPKELKEVEEWAGVKDGNWTVKNEEKFARGFERWLRTGRTEREELKSTFNEISKWLKKVYKRIKGSPIEGKLTVEMRNFFDRLMEEPNLDSVIDGRKVIANLGGQYIIKDDEEDVKVLATYVLSPEFVAKDFPVAARLTEKIIESEFKATALTQEDYVEFEEAERQALHDISRMAGNPVVRKLTPKRIDDQLTKIRGALEVLTKGDKKEIKKLQKEKPGLFEAAKILRKYFDNIREDIKTYKKDLFIRMLPAPYSNAFKEAIEIYMNTGDLSQEDFNRLTQRVDIDEGRFKEYVKAFTDIDNWGIDDYITNMERGTIKLVTDDGRVVSFALSERDAIRDAKEFLKNNPDVKAIELDTSAMAFDPHAELSRMQYWMVFRKINDASNNTIKNLREALGQGIKITPTHKFAGPMQKRKDVLKGEPNIMDVIYTYSYVMRKKMAIDKVVLDVRDNVGSLPPNLRKMILRQLEDAKGRYYLSERIVDDLFGKTFGLRPFLLTRIAGKIRRTMSNLKIGYRVVAPFVNYVSGQGHTWVKYGTSAVRKGRSFLKTDKGKDFIERIEILLGTTYAIDTETHKTKKGFKLWKPLGIFSAVEYPNRHVEAATAYVVAIEEGKSVPEAERFARQSVRTNQFTYNLTSLPTWMRSPEGKVVGQFKTYLIKEIEFISMLKGTGQWMRYLGLQMALAGPRGLIWIIRSLPFIGLFGIWDDIEEWLSKEHPDIPIAGDSIPTLSRGVVGALGGDITMPATVQLPNKPEDWAGPFLSDVIRLYTDVARPWMEGEKYTDMNFKQWLLRIAPATYYWDQLLQSVMDEDGWIRDQRSGNKIYKVTSEWDRALLLMGVSPIKRSDAMFAERMFKKEEDLRNRNARKALSKLVSIVQDGKDVPKELIDDLIYLGVSFQTIRQSIVRKQLPPRVRVIQESRKLSRPRAFELFQK